MVALQKRSIALWLRLGLSALFLAAITLLLFLSSVQGQEVPPDTSCVGCHVDNEGEIVLPSGEVLSVDVDLEALAASVHDFHQGSGETTIFCTDCHDPADYTYPHRPLPVDTLDGFRDMTSQSCQRCHLSIEEHNPGHLVPEVYDLNDDLPTCADCHGGHDVIPAELLAEDSIAFCRSCHQTFGERQVATLHELAMDQLGPEQDCQTCHSDDLAAAVNAPTFTGSEQCINCHSLLEFELGFAEGGRVSIHVTGEEVADSVHGDRLAELEGYRPLLCVDCHDRSGYQIFPHDVAIPVDLRQYVIDRSGVCVECHADIAENEMDGIHAHALAEGNLDAATCVDCHGAHDIQPPDEPRQRISLTCGKCHSQINNQYVESVHGAALFAESNPDVPTCVDCHGVHGIPDPNTALFRLRSPEICAECHADEQLMAKYDISTEVFDTYVADFHGTTVAIFEQTAPDQVPNEAVCYDCHGVHNILPVTNESAQVIKANLLDTCRQCHPTASANFPDAWMSHYQPSLEHYPIVFFVDLFYDILIPLLVGGFLVYVIFDAYRRLMIVWQRRRHERTQLSEESQ